MSRRFGFFLIWALLTLLIAGGVAAYAYHLGTLATVTAAGGGYVVHPYYGFAMAPFLFFPFFPLLGFLFFFFVLFAIFGGMRRRWYGGYGPGGHGPYGHHQHGLPPAFEEWHRRAHGEAPAAAPGRPGDEPPKPA